MTTTETPKTITRRTKAYKEAVARGNGWHVHVGDHYIGYHLQTIDQIVEMASKLDTPMRLGFIGGNVLGFVI